MSSTFQDMLANDVAAVFINPDEFGETHTLDGVEYIMVVDDDQLEQWKAINIMNTMRMPDHALASVRVYIFIALAIYPEPNANQVITYDGWPLRVVSTMTANGMLEMVLGGMTEHG